MTYLEVGRTREKQRLIGGNKFEITENKKAFEGLFYLLV
jgi:hypothetical protein